MYIGNIKVINGAQYSSDGKVLLRCHSDTTGDFIVPDGVEIIKEKAFYMSKIRSVKFPDSLEYIENAAFEFCENLEHIDFGIGNPYLLMCDNVFEFCKNLKSVDIPGTISIIGKNCFRECPLEQVVLHEGTVKIENYAFFPVEHIKEIHLPATLMIINRCNFLYAEKVHVSNIYCSSAVKMCTDSDGLTECHMNGKTVYIPKGTTGDDIIGHIQFNMPERLSYLDILSRATSGKNKMYANAVKIAQKTGDKEVINFLKENQSYMVNFLYEECDAILGAVRLNILSEKNLLKILHTDCFADDTVVRAHVLDALKKYDYTPKSEYDI